MDKRAMLTRTSRAVAGLVVARCVCCREAQRLVSHPSLDAAHLVCPVSRLPYLDRGDGLFERTEEGPLALAIVRGPGEDAAPVPAPDAAPESTVDVLSDRPSRTGPKEQITLERATFAGARGARAAS
jgi:hypothetical protein